MAAKRSIIYTFTYSAADRCCGRRDELKPSALSSQLSALSRQPSARDYRNGMDVLFWLKADG
jgi:hypothetical protein